MHGVVTLKVRSYVLPLTLSGANGGIGQNLGKRPRGVRACGAGCFNQRAASIHRHAALVVPDVHQAIPRARLRKRCAVISRTPDPFQFCVVTTVLPPLILLLMFPGPIPCLGLITAAVRRGRCCTVGSMRHVPCGSIRTHLLSTVNRLLAVFA